VKVRWQPENWHWIITPDPVDTNGPEGEDSCVEASSLSESFRSGPGNSERIFPWEGSKFELSSPS
jgi:hypothetical protein